MPPAKKINIVVQHETNINENELCTGAAAAGVAAASAAVLVFTTVFAIATTMAAIEAAAKTAAKPAAAGSTAAASMSISCLFHSNFMLKILDLCFAWFVCF